MIRITRVALGLAVLLAASSATAKEAGSSKRVVLVTAFSGAKKQALRDKVVKALKESGAEVVETTKVDGKSADAKVVKAAAAAKADAVVSGNGVLKKSGWKLELTVRSAEDGHVVDELELVAPILPKLFDKVEESATGGLAESIDKAAPQEEEPDPKLEEEPEPKDEEKAKPEEEPEPKPEDESDDRPAKDKGPRPSPFELGAGVRAFNRTLRYNQDVNANLRKYDFPGGPAAFAKVVWYPGAHFTSGFGANIGITGAYEQSFATSSQLESGGPTYGTTLRAWAAGLRLRLPFGTHEAGVSARYGAHDFEVDGDTDPGATAPIGAPLQRDYVPDVSYKYARLGADLRLGLGDVTLGAALGFRQVFSAGSIESDRWFPDASVLSGDAEIFGGYQMSPDVAALVGVSGVRYGLDMNSRPSDLAAGRDVAGGAIDQYLSVWTGIEWRPGTKPQGSDAASSRRVLVGKR